MPSNLLLFLLTFFNGTPPQETGFVSRIRKRVTLSGDLDDTQRARLLEIADRCPVHRTLTSEILITTDSGPA